MLCELKIKNLALIESLHLDLCNKGPGGLVVMTGETGAGKSIMLRAIHLLTGGRAATDWIRNGEEKCVVEALFTVSQENSLLQALFEKQGLDVEDSLVVKRILSSKSGSRMYINGSPATVKMGLELTINLLNVASQHDHQQLLQVPSHVEFIDIIGESLPLSKSFGNEFAAWQEMREKLSTLKKQEQEKEQRRDFLQFQIQEIREIEPVVGEDEELGSEKKRLKGAEDLIRLSQKSYLLLSGSLQDGLTQIRLDMSQAAELDGEVEELATELGTLSFLAEDLVAKLRTYKDNLSNDPHRLDEVNERLNALQSLKRKYGATLVDVLQYQKKAEQELLQIKNLDKAVEECEAELGAMEEQLCQKAEMLSQKRKKTASLLEAAMKKELESLAFNQASLEVRFHEHGRDIASLRAGGWDRIEFFFSANPGEPPRPLAKVASGGELSRLMLAFKCLLAKKDMVETVIFDEMDAGIGGEAAEAVARKIQELASHHQVLCITHLPQIAARGTSHFHVKKGVEKGRTQSEIAYLEAHQRIDEISRMLAGDSVTKQTRAWAEELLRKKEECK